MSHRELPGAVRADLFGGRGSVVVRDLLQGRPAPPFGAVLSCTLEAGGTVGRHRQEAFAEVVVVLAGTGRATVDGLEQALAPGGVVHLPLGAVLSLEASADAPLDYLIVKA